MTVAPSRASGGENALASQRACARRRALGVARPGSSGAKICSCRRHHAGTTAAGTLPSLWAPPPPPFSEFGMREPAFIRQLQLLRQVQTGARQELLAQAASGLSRRLSDRRLPRCAAPARLAPRRLR
eukprot:NODE_5209_length_603_cov_3.195255.p1 GENE.NODE_5209_length_603_cov_3.195255~~NODE_5209_length_603_cov_3.195255.p1  ORF type:complete len:127 (-),score=16.28 NODE_5209_length_603_cov_3.195255:26-406(-)